MRRLKAGSSEQVVWRARLVLGCLALIALCFQRAPGQIVPDRRLELTAGPGGFLSRALHLWDPHTSFGQLQSDAYGYLFPMGPFHWLLDTLSVPDWVTQRLWWSLVLCVAFLGIWKLCNVLQYGVPWTRLAVALLYAVVPLAFGGLAIEVWPLAMAPWVLMPLVSPGSRSGWWRVSWSAVAFALIGGANPIAGVATLVVPAVWLVARARLKLTAAWLGFVVAASIWWLVPLLMLLRYGVAPQSVRWVPVAGAVVGVPLALAAAHYLRRLTNLSVSQGVHRRVVPVLVTCLAVAAAVPVVLARPDGAFAAIPQHWEDAANWLDEQTTPGSVLVLPGSSEPLAALVSRPLAALTNDMRSRIDSGVGDSALRQELTRDGVRYVVVRNDVPEDTPSLAIHESLADSGIGRVAYFGPPGQSVLPYPSVEIYDVGATTPGRLIPRSRLVAVGGTADDVPTVVAALGGQGAAVLRADANGKLDGLPLIATESQPTDGQPSAVVLRNAQIGRSACLHVGARALCSQDQEMDSAEPNGLSRSVQLPQAATYQLRGTALPQDGEALERLLSVPGAIAATASSRAVAAPEGRPDAAVDRDLGTGWLAAPDDPTPSLTLKLPVARDVKGLRFQAYLNGSRPAEVVLHFDGGAPLPATVDAGGYVRFSPRHAQTVRIDFTATKPLQDARTSPVGVTEVEVLGADELRKAVAPQRRAPVYCGNGPTVRVDGVPARTQVAATMRDLLQRRHVTFSLCGQMSAFPLRSGLHRVEVQTNGGLVPIEATLAKAGFGDVSVTPVQGVDVWRPNPTELTVEVPGADEQSVLAVAQNYNEGWEAYDGSGQKLTPIRIGGWQQGWVLPAGPEQVVTASFLPDRTYRAGLLLGLVALLSVLATAAFFSTGRSTRR
ncbi:alpha-(1-_3)-arabinofuranosyltransferase domain-containing protein [Kribbella sindirgiensis]|uniref:alpha-(1->3)-arabinofuranosyltransferase domain-containing protein n=1 Tax=Kribbella sindirgiensis TaxID=1124744 RepID=UPI0013F49B10|nr:alpha-(1->3)-arabinofuranosyltransferase family protein [Kribbella sindirgiensis]